MNRYDEVAMLIRRQIAAGTLKIGERLPSVRQMSAMTGYSCVTVHHGYELLESQGICIAHQRSGFYVTKAPQQLSGFPKPQTALRPAARPADNLLENVALSWAVHGVPALGSPEPSIDLFKRETLDRTYRQVLRRGNGPGAPYPEGDPRLRHEIARRQAQRGAIVDPDSILITASAMDAYSLCLDAFTSPGDAVLVESPSYFPMLAILKKRGLQIIELYSHPVLGADPNQFAYLLEHNPIKVAILMVGSHYPTGITYSAKSAQAFVEAAHERNVVLIENDMLGELDYNGAGCTLKQFDTDDAVIQFSSFAQALSPAYGLGWIVAGRHARKLLATQYLNGVPSVDVLFQKAIAEHLSNRSYDRHLRIITSKLAARMQMGAELVAEAFPRECSLSQPDGGYMCWLRCPMVDTNAVAAKATDENIGILPGSMFSIAGSFQNFLALNFSFPWTERQVSRIRRLGELIEQMGKAARPASWDIHDQAWLRRANHDGARLAAAP